METLKVGKFEPVVSIEGTVRDKDIDPEDIVSSDVLLNMKLQVQPQSDLKERAGAT